MNITASAVSLTVADPERSARFLEQRFDFEREMTAEGFVSLTRSRPAFASRAGRSPRTLPCRAELRRPLRLRELYWTQLELHCHFVYIGSTRKSSTS